MDDGEMGRAVDAVFGWRRRAARIAIGVAVVAVAVAVMGFMVWAGFG